MPRCIYWRWHCWNARGDWCTMVLLINSWHASINSRAATCWNLLNCADQ
jgi:hypothetical protein